jgi:TonB family protein
VRTSRWSIVLSALALSCGPAVTSTPDDVDERGSSDEVSERRLPELPRLGDSAPGAYLLPGAAVGSRDALAMVTLIRVEPDAFVISVDGSPHRSVDRTAAWPMACAARSIELAEGELRMELEEGAPLFVLASSPEAARVSLGLTTEHSRVVPREAISLEGCEGAEGPGGESSIAVATRGDSACVFPVHETLDEGAGLPVPPGAAARVVEEDGGWSLVEIAAPRARVRGWIASELVSDEPASSADWIAAALGSDRCAFPGRGEARASNPWLEGEEEGDPVPSIPESEIDRVIASGMSQIRACYEARLAEVPDLRATLEVRMVVDPDGQVREAAITRGASVDAALSRCVIERVRRWRFPAPRHGEVQLRRTFELP